MARYFGVPLRNGLPIGLGSAIGLSGPVDPDLTADNIELEDGADLLLESGGLILLEGLMPTLWLDFQYSTSLDPRITFSRGSQATLFDSTGTLKYAKHNLLLQSQFASGWSFSNASFTSTTIAPDGTNTGEVLNDSSAAAAGYTFQGVSVTSGTAYVFSVFAKSVGLTSITLRNFTQAGAVAFNLIGSGSAETPTGTFSSPAITAVGNGWYRCSVIFTATGTASNNIAFVANPTSFTGEAFAIWGAQFNLANMEGGVTSSLTTYYPTTTAAYYAPRFDYNPSTLQPLGLLIEEARTNSFPNSNDFSNATYWTVYGTAVATAGAATGPDGLTSASNLAGATNTTLGGDNIEESISISASTAYTFSVFVKSNGGTTVTLRLRDSTGGSTSSAALTVTSAWQRISLTRTMAAGATSVRCIIGATDGDIFIYGAQLEAGAFPTSYIPTTTTALTRNADVASMTGTNFSSWYNASEGTIVAEYVYSTTGISNQCAYSLDNGTSSETIIMASTTPAIDRPLSSAGGVGQLTGGLGNYTFTAQQLIKRAVAYKLNDYGTSVNGGAAATDTSYTVPSPDRLTIGAAGYFSGSRLNGTIRRIAYYSVRLTNAQLQALTA